MPPVPRFPLFARLLHWLMAAMILTMLFIGIFMVTSVGPAYQRLVDIHRPLGICILLLAVIRLLNRFMMRAPSLPDTLPLPLQRIAHASHIVLYTLMIGMPLIGWAMLSAGDYPVTMWNGIALPPILPHDPVLFAFLRGLHTWLAFALFATILAHLSAALLHGLILRDGVWQTMALRWNPAKRRDAG
ncbi:MAG: cytochrome b/b6 domain-containing protein [Acidocella sp.]|nr:cytochrome b/b6 domain-containing protein [Acidocella sp.]